MLRSLWEPLLTDSRRAVSYTHLDVYKRQVIQNLKLEDLDTEGYQKIVKISSVKDTEVITIAVTSKDPKEAAVIANEIVDVFRDKIYSIMNIENVTVLNSAKIPEKKSSPSNIKNTLIGFLLAVSYTHLAGDPQGAL